jgi:2',3'-cyclic-nucleotide 2'-phosphodiesterase (5'-nucleotidase family)
VVVVFRPPYQTDAATPGETIAPSQFFGQHGYLPDLVDLRHNVNMHGTFVAAGPGIREGWIAGVRAIDVAPTVAFLMDIPGPINARGRILYRILEQGWRLREITILNISDYHGQLVPVAEAADAVIGSSTALGPLFGNGGAAFLDTWFDTYRDEAVGPSITVAGGDSFGGATPPISNFFGDTPTVEIMNQMGFDADAVGNHSFDRGEQYFRNTLIPLADFPILSANAVDGASGETPPEWSPSTVLNVGGRRVGVIGFTTEDTPDLVFPGNLGPFVFTDPTEAINEEAAKLRARGVRIIIAVGHEGVTGGTVTEPTGPLVDIADGLNRVDAVIGDHNDFQVVDRRPNGILVSQNRGKGIRFTRMRLVYDVLDRRVIYETADFHKPWNIGVAPDPAIQARIDELNAELAPIFNTEIGESSVAIPRSDSCGRADGRLCESLIGDITTDAMRLAYDTDFAITNAGGLRADLTCPTTDSPDDFCPAFTPPPHPITRGQVLAVLPFGNVVSTVTVDGAELKAFLENGVSLMPAAQGRFPQVSGLCFTYDVGVPAGSRVLSVVRQAEDGSCTGPAVDLTAASTYTLAINDFISAGGDGYPVVIGRATTQELMDEVLADHVTANTPISPVLQGRIECTSSDAAVVCPVAT